MSVTVTLYQRNGIFYINYRYKGERIQKSLQTRNENVALEEVEKQKARLTLDLEETRPDRITLEKFFEEYKEWSKNNKALKTYKYDCYALDRYTKTWKVGLLKDVTQKKLESYFNDRKMACVPGTLTREIGLVRALFNRAIQLGYIQKNPASHLEKPKKGQRRQVSPPFFTENQVDLLLDKARSLSSYLYILIRVDVDTGLRKSELIHLSWKDINFDNNIIIVQAKPEIGWYPKDYELRSVPISPELATEIKEHKLKQHGLTKWAFPTVYGTLRKNNLTRDFRKLLEQTKLYRKGLGWHTLRHTFASHLIIKGVPLKAVSELLGHSSTKTTEIYSHLAPEHLRDAVKKLPFGKKKASRSKKKAPGLKVIQRPKHIP